MYRRKRWIPSGAPLCRGGVLSSTARRWAPSSLRYAPFEPHIPKPSWGGWWQPSSTLLRAPFNTETRWVLFEPPTIKEYTHFCRCCGYETSLLTKASQGMPRHKVKAGGSWCDGSGQPPLKSVLQRELPNTTIHSSQQLGTHDAILDWAARESQTIIALLAHVQRLAGTVASVVA